MGVRYYDNGRVSEYFPITKEHLQVQLLFSDSKTMATLVNYTCKSFIKLTSVVLFKRAPRKRRYGHMIYRYIKKTNADIIFC